MLGGKEKNVKYINVYKTERYVTDRKSKYYNEVYIIYCIYI